MIYKTELHCHTSEVSKCSSVPAKDFVEAYIEKGYSTLVITNHFSKYAFNHIEDAPWKEKIDLFMTAYHNAVNASKGRLNILLGMEYRNKYSANDYLVYGVTEDFLRKFNIDSEDSLNDRH
jgi:histidinol phosphatase-like PHP family hydrolase